MTNVRASLEDVPSKLSGWFDSVLLYGIEDDAAAPSPPAAAPSSPWTTVPSHHSERVPITPSPGSSPTEDGKSVAPAELAALLQRRDIAPEVKLARVGKVVAEQAALMEQMAVLLDRSESKVRGRTHHVGSGRAEGVSCSHGHSHDQARHALEKMQARVDELEARVAQLEAAPKSPRTNKQWPSTTPPPPKPN